MWEVCRLQSNDDVGPLAAPLFWAYPIPVGCDVCGSSFPWSSAFDWSRQLEKQGDPLPSASQIWVTNGHWHAHASLVPLGQACIKFDPLLHDAMGLLSLSGVIMRVDHVVVFW